MQRSLAELAGLRAERDAWATERDALERLVGTLKDTLTAEDVLVARLKEVDAARASANASDAAIEASFKASLDAASKRIADLERQLAASRAHAKWWLVAGAALGAFAVAGR